MHKTFQYQNVWHQKLSFTKKHLWISVFKQRTLLILVQQYFRKDYFAAKNHSNSKHPSGFQTDIQTETKDYQPF